MSMAFLVSLYNLTSVNWWLLSEMRGTSKLFEAIAFYYLFARASISGEIINIKHGLKQ